jgi:hypothetical protein
MHSQCWQRSAQTNFTAKQSRNLAHAIQELCKLLETQVYLLHGLLAWLHRLPETACMSTRNSVHVHHRGA